MTTEHPETQAMLDGAEIEKSARDMDGEHTPRTHPVDRPPSDVDERAPLTTDPATQRDDSVINPETT